jgi:hypothetical protein
MTQTDDEKWIELIGFFLNDMASSLTPILGNSEILEIYLEALTQHDNSPIYVDRLKGTLTAESALKMIQVIRTASRNLSRLKSKLYEDRDKLWHEIEE